MKSDIDMSHELSAMNRKGFTIVELAIVLVLVGILITLGIKMIGPLTERTKISDTKGTIDAAVEAVAGFASANRRLPTATEFTGTVKKPNDAWGNPLYYIVDGNLAPATPVPSTDYICGRKTTGITVRNCLTNDCTTTAGTDYNDIPNVAFAIVSGGINFNVQTAVAAGRATVYVQNGSTNRDACTTAANCPNYTGTLINRPERYDDIVNWVTLNELRTKTGCQGASLQILNNELPSTSLGSSYTANVFAAGGVPYLSGTQNQYRWCVEIRNRTIAQGPPNGVSFNPSFIRYPDSTQLGGAASTYCSDRVEGTWPAWANNLVIAKTINSTETGSFNITVFTRDHNSSALNSVACNDTSSSTNRDNCANKSFVLTISP